VEIARECGVRAIPVCGDLSKQEIVKRLAEGIRAKFGRIDILVCCADGDIGAPGDTVTERFKASRPMEEGRITDKGSLERCGWPIEIARVVEFLVSPGSSYMTGQILRVDGGKQTWPTQGQLEALQQSVRRMSLAGPRSGAGYCRAAVGSCRQEGYAACMLSILLKKIAGRNMKRQHF